MTYNLHTSVCFYIRPRLLWRNTIQNCMSLCFCCHGVARCTYPRCNITLLQSSCVQEHRILPKWEFLSLSEWINLSINPSFLLPLYSVLKWTERLQMHTCFFCVYTISASSFKSLCLPVNKYLIASRVCQHQHFFLCNWLVALKYVDGSVWDAVGVRESES